MCPRPARPARPRPPGSAPRCNLLGPTALGFRHRDDLREITGLLEAPGHRRARGRARWARRRTTSPPRRGRLQCRAVPRDRSQAAALAAAQLRPAHTRTCRSASGDAGVHRRGGAARRPRPAPALADAARAPTWYSRSVDSTYLTGKRVFVFGDATHAIAAARVAQQELGFTVVGLGTYSREFARDVREAAKLYGVEALITDDYLEVEAKVAELQPELVLGTQMERHIAKRLGVPCAVISAPVHVQDFPARYSPQMGFEGANVLFDTWVHPLMMGLEEHLLDMFRGDFEFHDGAAPSHLGRTRRAGRAAANRTPGARGRDCRSHRQRHRHCRLGAGSREGTAEDPVLRARQGAPQHRALRAERGVRRSPWRRSTMPKHTSAAEATPIRVVIVTLDTHLASATERAQRRWRETTPALAERCMPPPSGATTARSSAARPTSPGRHRHRHDAVPGRSLPADAAGAARRAASSCDAMVCACPRRGDEAHPHGQVRHGQAGQRPDGAAEALRGKKDKGTGHRRAQQMKMLRRLPRSCASSPAPRRTCAPIS
jgi:hypothetical protein